MMTRLLALLLILLSPAASAQDLPAAFRVVDVAADDRLNVRAAPDAGADILGSYSPYALQIEVLALSPDGRWGQVGWGETNGWVAMRYLAADPASDPHGLPDVLVCGGTEPFWNLGIYPRGDEYSDPGTGRRDLERLSGQSAPNGFIGTWQEGPTLNRTLIVKQAQCSDGMSDRTFGWQALLFNTAPDGNSVAAGCCTLDRGHN